MSLQWYGWFVNLSFSVSVFLLARGSHIHLGSCSSRFLLALQHTTVYLAAAAGVFLLFSCVCHVCLCGPHFFCLVQN